MKPPTPVAWARALDDVGLALELRRLSAGTYLLPTEQRQAVLEEAARRLARLEARP